MTAYFIFIPKGFQSFQIQSLNTLLVSLSLRVSMLNSSRLGLDSRRGPWSFSAPFIMNLSSSLLSPGSKLLFHNAACLHALLQFLSAGGGGWKQRVHSRTERWAFHQTPWKQTRSCFPISRPAFPRRRPRLPTRSISNVQESSILLAADRQTYYSLASTLRHQMHCEEEERKHSGSQTKFDACVYNY